MINLVKISIISFIVLLCFLVFPLTIANAEDDSSLLSSSEALQESYVKLQDIVNLRDDLATKKAKETEGFTRTRIYVVQMLVGLFRVQERPSEVLIMQDIKPSDAALTYMSMNEIIRMLYNHLRDLAISLQASFQLSGEISKLSIQAQETYQRLEQLSKTVEQNPKLATNPKVLATQRDLQNRMASIREAVISRTNYLISLSDVDKKAAEEFASNKGKFSWPSNSRLLYRFKEAPSSSQFYDGIAFATVPNEEILAPFAGEVIYFKPFNKYGYILILKHAPDYYSVFMGLKSISVKLTQKVVAGETLGRMPSVSSALLYSIKQGNVTQNPLIWLKKR